MFLVTRVWLKLSSQAKAQKISVKRLILAPMQAHAVAKRLLKLSMRSLPTRHPTACCSPVNLWQCQKFRACSKKQRNKHSLISVGEWLAGAVCSVKSQNIE